MHTPTPTLTSHSTPASVRRDVGVVSVVDYTTRKDGK